MPKHSAKWPCQVSRTAALPSAKILALGKNLKVCRVPGSSTRQSSHVARPWVGTLPSARRRHSAKCPPRVAPHGRYAECQGSRQSLCRVPEIRHSAKPTLPSEALPSALCRVLHSAKPLPSANRPLLSVTGTRQSQ